MQQLKAMASLLFNLPLGFLSKLLGKSNRKNNEGSNGHVELEQKEKLVEPEEPIKKGGKKFDPDTTNCVILLIHVD